jgi:branched-chain amino acid transport system ATP-binding protein
MNEQQTTPLLEIRGLTVRFGGLVAINELDLHIAEGEIFALVGPNGAGKTTALNCISGLIKPTAGSIHFAGQELLKQPAYKRASLGIGRTFQQLQLFTSMSVLDNLLTAQHAHLRAGILTGILPFGPGKREDARARAQARETLALLGLAQYAESPVGSLPFGVQKLVGVARALVLRPRLVLLDEPAAGVPPQEMDELATNLRTWRDRLGTALLLIEHNMHIVQAVSDRVCVLDYGSKLAEGEPKAVLSDPAVLEAYLGREASKQVAQSTPEQAQEVSHAEN